MSILKTTHSGKEHLKLYLNDFHDIGYYIRKNETQALYKDSPRCPIEITCVREEQKTILGVTKIPYTTVRYVIKSARVKLIPRSRDHIYYFYINSKADLELVTDFFKDYRGLTGGWERKQYNLIKLAQEKL